MYVHGFYFNQQCTIYIYLKHTLCIVGWNKNYVQYDLKHLQRADDTYEILASTVHATTSYKVVVAA